MTDPDEVGVGKAVGDRDDLVQVWVSVERRASAQSVSPATTRYFVAMIPCPFVSDRLRRRSRRRA